MNSLILGLLGAAILLGSSKAGITLSSKRKSIGIQIAISMVVIQVLLLCMYTLMGLTTTGIQVLPFISALGFGIVLDIAYKIYLAIQLLND